MAPDIQSTQEQPQEQRLTRPNLPLDPTTQAVTFKDARERALYIQDLMQQGVMPKHLDSVAKVENAYRMLNQLSLPWEMYLNKTYYVGAQLTLMAEPLLSACRATGKLEYMTWEWVNGENEKMTDQNVVGFKVEGCICKAKRADETKEVMFGFTMAEAKDAGLSSRNQNYQKFTKDMLMWRATGRVLKVLFTEICGGVPVQGVDDLIPMQDEHGKQMMTDGGQPIYQARQARTRGRIDMLTGGK